MSDLPPYPPPPPDPPESQAAPAPSPAATYPPAPKYASATPAYAYPPAPRQRRASGNLWIVIASVVVVVVLVVGVIAYVSAGYVYASSRISDAIGAINGAVAHRAYVNTTFDLLDQQVSSFTSISDAKVARSTAGQLVSESQSIRAIVGSDDRAMAAARSHLHDQQWLTAISSGRLAAEAGRIDHARTAAVAVKSAADGYLLLGQFYQAFFQALIDWDTMQADAKNNDFVGTSSADALLGADAAKAQQLTANAPGLPSQYHDFLVILQAYAVDVGKVLNARTTADFDAADKQVTADLTAMNTLDFTGIAAKIKSYYQRYRDDFNAEMDKATT